MERGSKVKRKENYVGVNLDGMINLTNLFCGYKPGRVFEGTLFVGPSVNFVKNYAKWVVGYESNNPGGGVQEIVPDPATTDVEGHKLRCLVGASVGLGAKFNINKYFSIDLEARGQVTPSILGAYSSGKTDGYVYFSAGGTYVFGGKKFVPVNGNINMDEINDQLNAYRDQLLLCQAELAEALNALANAQPQVIEVIKEVQVAGPRAIFFQIGSS